MYTCPSLNADQRHVIIGSAVAWIGSRYDYLPGAFLAVHHLFGGIVLIPIYAQEDPEDLHYALDPSVSVSWD